MMQYGNIKRLFQEYNAERYHQAKISIAFQSNEGLNQKITKGFHRVELQGPGEENILIR